MYPLGSSRDGTPRWVHAYKEVCVAQSIDRRIGGGGFCFVYGRLREQGGQPRESISSVQQRRWQRDVPRR